MRNFQFTPPTNASLLDRMNSKHVQVPKMSD